MSSGAGMPPQVVLGLTAAVLAAHVWLLHRSPPRIQPVAVSVRPAPFATRIVAATPPPAAPVATAAGPRSMSRAPARRVARLQTAAPAVERPAAAEPTRTEPVPEPSALPHEAVPAAPGGPVRVSIPASMHLRYQVTARVKQGTSQGASELAWHHDGTSYEARFEVRAPWSRPRVQHSTGRVAGDGLEPLRFGDRSRGEQAAHFDREEQRVVFSNNRPAVPLAPGAQDRLSVLLQLAALLAGAPGSFPAGATVLIQTATTREADAWIFTVDGEEQLRLPGGDLAAVKLTRPPRGEFDQRLEVWLAPGQAYVPVRLRLTQPNGDSVDHQWSATDRR